MDYNIPLLTCKTATFAGLILIAVFDIGPIEDARLYCFKKTLHHIGVFLSAGGIISSMILYWLSAGNVIILGICTSLCALSVIFFMLHVIARRKGYPKVTAAAFELISISLFITCAVLECTIAEPKQ